MTVWNRPIENQKDYNKYNNNLDFLRFIFASFVIISHSYFLLDLWNLEPLFLLTDFMVFSSLGVYGFFIISGYLIQQSLARSKSIKHFVTNRIKRIVPGLWTVIILSFFVLGPWQTELGIGAYFTNMESWKYLFSNAFLLPLMPTLPEVFNENPFGRAVNGSLWTLRYEFLFYALIIFLFNNKENQKKILLGFVWLGSFIMYFALRNGNLNFPIPGQSHLMNFSLLINLFSAGSLLSLFEGWIMKYRVWIFCISSFLFIFGLYFFQSNVVFVIVYPFLTMSFGKMYFSFLHFSKYIGDISYGTYIYAFPIQQILIAEFSIRDPIELLCYSLLLSWVFGYLSWQFIEKYFLLKKNS